MSKVENLVTTLEMNIGNFEINFWNTSWFTCIGKLQKQN